MDNEFGKEIVNIENTGEETSSSLPIAEATLINTAFSLPPEMSGQNLEQHAVIQKLAQDEARNNLIVDHVIKDYDAGHSVLVASSSLEHLDILLRLLKKRGRSFSLLTGETNTNTFYTQNLIEGVFKRTVRGVLASTQAVKLGANLNPLDRLHIVIPPSNCTDVEQLAGRIRRKHEGKKDAVIRYYLDVRCSYLYSRFKRAFVPTMRKLHVPRYADMWIA